MKIVLSLLLFLSTFYAHAETSPKTCVEMMKLHYSWVDQNKCKLANKQLEIAVKYCSKFLNNEDDRDWIKLLISKDNRLVNLYGKLMDKNKQPRNICPYS